MYIFPCKRIRYIKPIAINTHIDCLNNSKCSVRYIFKATKQGASKVTLHHFLLEGNPKDKHPLKQKGSLRKQQMGHLLNMTEGLHDYNEGCDDLTKEPTVDLPFIPQQDGTTNDTKGDITEYADEVGIEQIIDQEDNDISYGLTSEENAKTDEMLWKTVEEDIIKGNMDDDVFKVGFTRRDKVPSTLVAH